MYYWGKQNVEEMEGAPLTEESRLDLRAIAPDSWVWVQVGTADDNCYQANSVRELLDTQLTFCPSYDIQYWLTTTKAWACKQYLTTKEYARRERNRTRDYTTEELEAEVARRKKEI